MGSMIKKLFGKGVDPSEIEQLKQLAEQGDADAQYKVGRMYEEGIGVTKDESMAWDWYQKAEEQGHQEAHLASLKMAEKALKSLDE